MDFTDFLNDADLIEQARKAAQVEAENYRKQKEKEFKQMAFEQLKAKFLAEEKAKIDKEFEEKMDKLKEASQKDVKPIESPTNPDTFNSKDLSRRQQLIEFINRNNLTNPSHEEKNMIIRYAYDELGYRFKSTADWYNEIDAAIDEIEDNYEELKKMARIEEEAAPSVFDKPIQGSLLE